MRKRSVRGEAGFTLIEVLVAVLIITVALLGLSLLLTRSQNQSSSNVQEAQLINVADQQIEQVRAEVAASGFDELAMSAAPTPIASPTAVQTSNTWSNPKAFIEPVTSGNSACGTSGYGLEIASAYDNISTSSPGSAPYGSPPAGYVQWSGCPADVEPLSVITPVGSSWPTIVQTATGTPAECGSSTSSQANVTANSAPTSATITSPCTVSLNNGSFHSTATVYIFVTDTYIGNNGGIPCTTQGTAQCPCVATSSASCAGQSPTSPTLIGCGASSAFPSSSAASTQYSTICADARRVTVAVVPTGRLSTGRITPVYISTVFTNPVVSQDQQNAIGLTLGLHL